jgi:hypothetical protein
VAHCAFSQPGPWRHAVVARLARTLGRTERKFQAACCLANSCPPAFAQVARRVRNRSPNYRKRCQLHCAISDHQQFIQRNFKGLSNGASRRALRRTVSQLSRPRAAIGKAAAVRCLASSANEKYIQALATIAPSVPASSSRSCRPARVFPSRCSPKIRRSVSVSQWLSSRLAAKQRGAA